MTPHNRVDVPTEWDALPQTITTHLAAHAAGEDDRALATFAPDAVVTDEGHDHVGRDEVKSWLTDSATEYTYTTEFTSATTSDAASVDVVQHLEGNFPGGTADLHFRFSLEGTLISRLVIEP